MTQVSDQHACLTVECQTEAGTHIFAEDLSLALQLGDVISLSGELGSGKTFLVRALIRSAAQDPDLEVPSPTFTLVQSYEDLPFGRLAHVDLYRLSDSREVDELGLVEAAEIGVVLIEWPERGAGFLPDVSLEISIETGARESQRIFSITGTSRAMERLQRSLALRQFLNENNHANAHRTHFTGDASTRSYELVTASQQSSPLILMNAPAQSDGPPIKDEKSYSQIAHLAEDVSAYVGVTKVLEKNGFRVPRIYARDIDQGFLMIEHLGDGQIIDNDRVPIPERYVACVETLVRLHSHEWGSSIDIGENRHHHIHPFDRSSMLIEVDLLAQWYAPYRQGSRLAASDIEEFQSIWNALIAELQSAETSLVLRDFHSPNILWCGQDTGVARTGLIDFQDAMIGPTAYDLASLAQDARVDVSRELEHNLVDHYCMCRQSEIGFDEQSFRRDYAIMAAERATKVLGIFVRLSKRDGKHDYLAHLPRIEDYISRSFHHPVLATYRDWFERVIK